MGKREFPLTLSVNSFNALSSKTFRDIAANLKKLKILEMKVHDLSSSDLKYLVDNTDICQVLNPFFYNLFQSLLALNILTVT